MTTSRRQQVTPEDVVFDPNKRRGSTIRFARENHKHAGLEDALTTVAGTTDEIVVTLNADGSITLALADNPIIKGSTANRLTYTDGDKKLQSVADITAWIGTLVPHLVHDSDGDGTGTLRFNRAYNYFMAGM